MKPIKASELILNPDKSIYHLNLQPQNIAQDIIFVGDPDRVEEVTKYFDKITFCTQKREFKTQTGTYKGKPLTVISTGIGTDNIDIVLNELDALVNIDFDTRQIKQELTSLNIVRIGTSGALQKDIPVDTLLMSAYAIGTDDLLNSYDIEQQTIKDLEDKFIMHTNWHENKGRPYAVEASESLMKKFSSEDIYSGITLTAGGFFAPQGRVLRLLPKDNYLQNNLDGFSYKGYQLTNLEMETAGIYGLAKLLNHNTLSLNAIIANRKKGVFSEQPQQTIDRLIRYTLDKFIQ